VSELSNSDGEIFENQDTTIEVVVEKKKVPLNLYKLTQQFKRLSEVSNNDQENGAHRRLHQVLFVFES